MTRLDSIFLLCGGCDHSGMCSLCLERNYLRAYFENSRDKNSSLKKIFLMYLSVLGLSCSMWDLVPWVGIKPGSPELRGQSLTTGPPEVVVPRAENSFNICLLPPNLTLIWLAKLEEPCINTPWRTNLNCNLLTSFQNQMFHHLKLAKDNI